MKVAIMVFMMLGFFTGSWLVRDGYAQDKKEKDKEEVIPKKDESQPKTDPASAFLIVCDAQPARVILLDANGKWVPTVKSVEIKFDLGGVNTITCVLYEGPLKPTAPIIKTWVLSQMKSVTAVEFQKMIDSLQSSPEAIKTSLK
jgi:hypothetical protein